MKHKLKVAASLCLTTLLAACGGGGGGGSATPPTSTSTGSTAPTSTNTGSTPTPQYPAGSQELAALNQLNAMRQQCGFSELSENTLLDQAAVNHLLYMQDNAYVGHTEIQGNPGFTGVTPQNRAQAVGFYGADGEENAGHTSDVGGALSIIGLSSVPYHEALLFGPSNQFGAAYGTVVMGPSVTYYVPEITFGYTTPSTIATAPLTFPCQGTTGVNYESAGMENPAPMGIDTETNPIGTPIAVIGNASDTVTLTGGTLTGPSGQPITLSLLDSTNDANHEMPSWAAVAFPTSPLQPNTLYTAHLTGTLNGAAFAPKSFTFTTGAQGQF